MFTQAPALAAALTLTSSVRPGPASGQTPATQPPTFDGYTLIAPHYHTTTYLVDSDGKIDHYWKINCSADYPGLKGKTLAPIDEKK